MASRRDRDGLEPYSSSNREQWLHSLKLALRDKSKFAREMVEGTHNKPAGVCSPEQTAAPDDFSLGRMEKSTVVLTSDVEGDTSERAEFKAWERIGHDGCKIPWKSA